MKLEILLAEFRTGSVTRICENRLLMDDHLVERSGLEPLHLQIREMKRREKEEKQTKSTSQRTEEEDEQRKTSVQSPVEEEEETTDQRRAAAADGDQLKEEKKKEENRKCVPGIVYLGHIPPRLRPKHLRNLLSAYGEVGRIFLQPEDRQVRRKRKKSGSRRCDFIEGWVEFRDKRVAKRVALSLHNTPMGTRKRQRFFSDLWNIKYLHKFQWTHLSERLAYEQTVLQQRLRAEVSQVKRETNFYLNNVEKSTHLEHLRRKRQRDGQQVEEKTWDFTQRQTEEEIQKKKKKKDSITQKHLNKAHLLQLESQSNISLLAKIFNSNQSE
ncbi:activator of basal transcription 1 isoform X1 [Girardinichthys multiradiatus]|uniref:activator of basal transcription 1 isoform X1 n=3 Tax=Girardinichthys multiradiatus TaxID=208333 RepID=UPI001FACC4FF|nr:activator of basal transcription 1 isoform X1 [Girardinichthys multiradiatus]